MRAIIISVLLGFIFLSCDKGLSPDLADEKSGFGGKVTFIGEWDPSIKETHVVVFKNPLLSISDFNVFNLSFVSESIPNGTSNYEYTSNDENSLISNITDGHYSYIAVAQSLRDTITLNREDWIVVGLYYTSDIKTEPGELDLPPNTYLNNIDIECDFNNLPVQPPGGVLREILNQIMKNEN